MGIDEESGFHESNSVPREAECRTSTNLTGSPDGDNLETFRENDETEEGEHIQDMDLESDPEQEQTVITESLKLSTEMPNEVKPEKSSDNVCPPTTTNVTVSKVLIDDSRVKRARVTYEDNQPCVRVVYNSLSRESKKKLMELMQQWSEWHALAKSSSSVNSEEALECGEEIYFPALNVGSKKTTAVSFWVDNQARNEDTKNIQLDHDSIPLYDRGYTSVTTSLGGVGGFERIETLEASRCFNCSSYGHSLKECPKPRDSSAISIARKQHSAKRNFTTGSRVQVRYYQKSQGKYDDLRPGVLGPETRDSLGIGEFDPPPWLNRMRELGYPPGYLDVEDDDQPSGIEIFADDTKVEYEDGEIPEKGDPVQPPERTKMTVEFPGINGPIPENADQRRWAQPSNSFRNRPQRGQYSDQFRGNYHHDRYRDDGQSMGSGFPAHSYSPRYGAYEHSNSSNAGRSPAFGRSLSDRGWQNHSSGYDNRFPPPPPGHSPSASLDRWPHGGTPSQSQGERRERQSHHDQRRNHRN
ncbi:zinc finger CCHC domain-containing protein 8-like isoform X2 [Asparagus officinalis]|uniref:zinc finger CCHC domain-containing protein 8-like isoform X2 n=1 Tax=Asparagus officinalis TaxID=4686 RepID=UPI00098E293F|nr:zinc finger CCHC domain-containing protein 8-like isoform X2 [Asparagus officinalis]